MTNAGQENVYRALVEEGVLSEDEFSRAAADLVDCPPSLREESARTEPAMAIGLAQFSEK